MRSGRKIVFLHIPKCAGISLGLYMNEQVRDTDREIVIVRGEAKGRQYEGALNWSPGRKAEVKILKGHILFGWHRVFEDALYITLLRDPAQRALSLYYYSRNAARHYAHKYAANMTPAQFCDVPEVGEARNHMIRVIAGLPLQKEVEPEDLETAKHNLELHFVYGFVEHLSESVAMWRRYFGWDDSPIGHHNRTARPEREHPNRIKAVRNRNLLDQELYDWALENWEELRKEWDSILARE